MFITNIRALFYLWCKENLDLVKHQNVSKYYENDCSFEQQYLENGKSKHRVYRMTFKGELQSNYIFLHFALIVLE